MVMPVVFTPEEKDIQISAINMQSPQQIQTCTLYRYAINTNLHMILYGIYIIYTETRVV